MNTLNSNQKTLKRMIQDTKLQISDEELFLSAAFQKHQTSLAKAATGRSRYGLQVITNWDVYERNIILSIMNRQQLKHLKE